ncbi:ABC transporter substrate-binding protein [Roseococcus pinisoli]|uniref:ABC transporter substrate-binding protein n=1 Tax=Roseococcus pinisoli TaxID=2835040 RepID=A0ABS5QI01_9PROT|nr:ABC transporter substrate-binding protein [Roseococcus pinisoli]MBS7813261.1 ABC transporter substrate-binding protein [Roseococcus pinisoli]
MQRRELLLGAASAMTVGRHLTAPALGAEPKTLIHVPQASMATLDPVWTTAVVTRNAGAMLWETLYGRDERLNPQPQMVEGHRVEDGGKRWTMRLREGLMFHDGEPVRARDCVASIRRWMKRDLVGQTIEARLDALEAPDDRTLVFRLSKPFASLPYALARTQPTPVIMPERLALTDPYRQVPEFIGSGPFRWVADEYVPGSRAIFAKFDRYRPRDEPASFCAGGYRVMVDRVEWRFIPDASTAASALMNGEVDWIDQPLPDLLPLLRRARGVSVEVLDNYGTFGAMRPNSLQGPTADPAIRRVMLAATDQLACMTAAMGDDRSLFRAPVGYFLPGTPSANDAGMEAVLNRPNLTQLKRMLAASGYAGERIVLMHPTDQSFYHAMTSVVGARFRDVGFNIDEQSMDWGTVVQRRASREPLDKGGWSLFPSGFPAAEYRDPINATNLRGNGAAAWFGWPEDPQVESMRNAWMDSTDEAEQQRLDRQIQQRAFETVPFIPLGQYMPPAAFRRNITGLLKGPVPVFWNVQKG